MLLSCLSPLHAQKTDLVTLENGDKITGEVKSLDRGKLEYSTDDMGTLNIEWDHIARLISRHFFEVEVSSGRHYFGSFEIEAPEDGFLVVVLGRAVDTLAMNRIVAISQIETGFFDRLSGYIDVGFTYAKANNIIQLTFGGEVKYRARKDALRLTGSTFVQDQDDATRTTRASLTLSYQRFFADKWAAALIGSMEQNSELDLDLRTYLGLGVVAHPIQTSKSRLQTFGGAIVNRELFEGEEEATVGGEIALGNEFDTFRFDDPELDFNVILNSFFSVTDPGRVRLDFETRLGYEILNDFFINLTVFDNFDSRSPSTGASTNDFGTTLSVRWKY